MSLNRRQFVRLACAAYLVVSPALLDSCSRSRERLLAPVVWPDSSSGFRKPRAVPERLATDSRKAIQLECFYALSNTASGSSRNKIGGNYVSDWKYLLSDVAAYTKLKNHYGDNSSLWTDDRFPSFFSNMGYYTHMKEKWTRSGPYGELATFYGRGGQCRYFANLILYRS
ncbi:MAG: hypothetical protein HYY50_03280 [Candidatus Kerfeldbacteria bacterium]|nr:hypothetical protein [Candidatus Kerfeldbacteria bacterium]